MKASIICGFVVSAISFGAMAGNEGSFTAVRDFTQDICEIADANGANNSHVKILINGDAETATDSPADFSIVTNATSAKWSFTLDGKPTNIPAANLSSTGDDFTGVAVDKAALIFNTYKYSFQEASQPHGITLTKGRGELKIQPKIYADAVDFTRGTAQIKGKVTLTCP